MSFLLGKDWNVLALTFERADLYRINGNRTKGRDSGKIADNAKRHARTIYWAIFNQKGKVIDSGPGACSAQIPAAAMERLLREFPKNESVLNVLEQLQRGESDKAAKIFDWGDAPEAKPAAPTPAAKPAEKAPPGPAAASQLKTKAYKLVVASDDGDEFESRLKLIDLPGRLSGTLVGPDGQEVVIDHGVRDGDAISFQFQFGVGDEAVRLQFQGKFVGDVVKGSLSQPGDAAHAALAASEEAPPAESAAPAQPTATTYKLVVASDDGDEFESSLKLFEQQGQLSGTLVAPDGEEVAIDHAVRNGAELWFEFQLGAGDETVCLHFQGQFLDDAVKGSFC